MFEKNVQTSNCTEIILNFFSRSTNKTRSVLNKSCQLENFNRLVTSIVSPLSVRICGTAHNTSLSAGYTELPINSKQIQLTGQWKTLLNYPISEHVHVHVPPFFSLSLKKKKKERKKNAAVFIARREFSPTRRRVQHGIKLFRIKCVVENRKRLTLK